MTSTTKKTTDTTMQAVKKALSSARMGTYETAAGSADTDLERKHLHLGIRRGADADIRGYVSDRAALSGWVDPCDFFCGTR